MAEAKGEARAKAESKATSQSEAQGASEAKANAEHDADLVLMHKIGHDPLRVHPTCVAAHEAAGWCVAA